MKIAIKALQVLLVVGMGLIWLGLFSALLNARIAPCLIAFGALVLLALAIVGLSLLSSSLSKPKNNNQQPSENP